MSRGGFNFFLFSSILFLALLNSVCSSSSVGRVSLYFEANVCFVKASNIQYIRIFDKFLRNYLL